MYEYKSIDRRVFARTLGVMSVVSHMGVDGRGSPDIVDCACYLYLDVKDVKANLTFETRPIPHQLPRCTRVWLSI
jgi:hypothetical protein